MSGNGSRPFLMGDRVRLLGAADGAFKEYAVVGAVRSRNMAVVLLAPADILLAPVFVYPASSLLWNVEAGLWQGPQPIDRSPLVLPG